jgi:2-keto-4-pentenoate hydratase/2-oxohepta-3-ene-1,7-dioic acid hydratase in catechol pathway
VAEASGNRFGPDPQSLYENWEDFIAWAEAADVSQVTDYSPRDLGVPVPRPPQVLAIGVNYKDHADEAGIPAPDDLVVFTKFLSSLGAPNTDVALPSEDVDYETEIVVVIGKRGHDIAKSDAWDHVAGIAIGQDYSERTVQRKGPVAQFSLGKSFPNFGPFGPWITTPDEFPDRDSIKFHSTIEGEGVDGVETLQTGDTALQFFDVAESIHRLSKIVTLLPGDIIFTGTPANVGLSRGELLKPGQTLTSTLDGIGSMSNTFVASTSS